MDRNFVLSMIMPAVQHAMYELPQTSAAHVIYEASAMSFLMGRGYDFYTAKAIVESWEIDEAFPPYQTQTGYHVPGYPHYY